MQDDGKYASEWRAKPTGGIYSAVPKYNIDEEFITVSDRKDIVMEKQQLVEIGQRLRRKRNELKLTREEFAELADLSVGFYGQLEVGTSQMSIDTLVKISQSMHLPMEYILFGTEYPKGDDNAVIEMLRHCSPNEQKLAEKVLKLFLMKK